MSSTTQQLLALAHTVREHVPRWLMIVLDPVESAAFFAGTDPAVKRASMGVLARQNNEIAMVKRLFWLVASVLGLGFLVHRLFFARRRRPGRRGGRNNASRGGALATPNAGGRGGREAGSGASSSAAASLASSGPLLARLVSSSQRSRVTLTTNNLLLVRNNSNGEFELDEDVLNIVYQLIASCNVYLITQCDDDAQQAQLHALFRNAGLFSRGAGIPSYRSLYCDTTVGRASIVRQIDPVAHVECSELVTAHLFRHLPFVAYRGVAQDLLNFHHPDAPSFKGSIPDSVILFDHLSELTTPKEG